MKGGTYASGGRYCGVVRGRRMQERVPGTYASEDESGCRGRMRTEAIWWARAEAYKRADVGGAYGVVVSGIAAGRKGVCAWSIIRNSFGYIAISIELNRKTSFCVIAEKWLKRAYIMNGREREGESRGGEGVGSDI